MKGKTSAEFYKYMQQYDIEGKGGLYTFKSNITREDFPTILSGWGCETGAEIGVGYAGNAVDLLNHLRGIIYFIDPWKYFPAGVYDTGARISWENCYNIAANKLKDFPNAKIIRKESVEALADIENGSLDFVYIDGNHAVFAVWYDLQAWWPKLKYSGVMSGHDISQESVCKAVMAFIEEKNITRWYKPGSNNWLFIKGEEYGGTL